MNEQKACSPLTSVKIVHKLYKMDKGGSNLKSQKNCLDNGGHYKETERIKIIVRERKKWGLLVLLNPAEYYRL